MHDPISKLQARPDSGRQTRAAVKAQARAIQIWILDNVLDKSGKFFRPPRTIWVKEGLFQSGDAFLWNLLEKLRLKKAGRNCYAADRFVRKIASYRQRHADYARLARRVSHLSLLTVKRRYGGGIYDHPSFSGLGIGFITRHHGGCETHHIESSAQINIEDASPELKFMWLSS